MFDDNEVKAQKMFNEATIDSQEADGLVAVLKQGTGFLKSTLDKDCTLGTDWILSLWASACASLTPATE